MPSSPRQPTAQPAATTGDAAPASSPAAGKAGSSLALAANPQGQLTYNTKQLSAKAGTVTITMTNMSPVEHNVTVAEGSKVLGATPTFNGGTKALTLKLKPGKYTFYCSVPGHRQAGMEGTLTSREAVRLLGHVPHAATRRAPVRERLPRAQGRGPRARRWSSPTGSAPLPGVFNRTRGRREVQELTGNRWVPALVLDDGTVIDGSREIVEWAQREPRVASW